MYSPLYHSGAAILDGMERDVDRIVRAVKAALPAVKIRQLQVAYPGADDDGVWWFYLPGVDADVQLDSSEGQCPFLVDYSDNDRPLEARSYDSIPEITDRIVEFLSRQALRSTASEA